MFWLSEMVFLEIASSGRTEGDGSRDDDGDRAGEEVGREVCSMMSSRTRVDQVLVQESDSNGMKVFGDSAEDGECVAGVQRSARSRGAVEYDEAEDVER